MRQRLVEGAGRGAVSVVDVEGSLGRRQLDVRHFVPVFPRVCSSFFGLYRDTRQAEEAPKTAEKEGVSQVRLRVYSYYVAGNLE